MQDRIYIKTSPLTTIAFAEYSNTNRNKGDTSFVMTYLDLYLTTQSGFPNRISRQRTHLFDFMAPTINVQFTEFNILQGSEIINNYRLK